MADERLVRSKKTHLSLPHIALFNHILSFICYDASFVPHVRMTSSATQPPFLILINAFASSIYGPYIQCYYFTYTMTIIQIFYYKPMP